MEEFKKKVLAHVEHIKTVGSHCTTEETTKQALILPLLNILDFSPFDPQKVKAEHGANFKGAKANERVDYALFSDGLPVMFIEAKPYNNKLTNHDGQLARYFNSTPSVTIAAITNGIQWRFFTDLKLPNVMDTEPFYVVNFEKLKDTDIEQLANFRYDMFNPDKLKSFAEERTYLDLLTTAIGTCLREVDQDFVRFITTKANLTPKLTAKFLESITPLVKQSLKDAISGMVISGLSAPVVTQASSFPTQPEPSPLTDNSSVEQDIVDPVNNKIVTTVAEQKIFAIVRDMVSGVISEGDVAAKDTESYYSVLFQNKTNRWIIRYVGDKKRPQAFFPIELSEQHRGAVAKAGLELGAGGSILLDKPENLIRLSGIILDSLAYCQDDNNFKRERGSKEAQL